MFAYLLGERQAGEIASRLAAPVGSADVRLQEMVCLGRFDAPFDVEGPERFWGVTKEPEGTGPDEGDTALVDFWLE